jgi:DHA1 family inner membrane transport protein
MTLMALALGSFVIGTSEFASMGIIQLFAGDLGLSIPKLPVPLPLTLSA